MISKYNTLIDNSYLENLTLVQILLYIEGAAELIKALDETLSAEAFVFESQESRTGYLKQLYLLFTKEVGLAMINKLDMAQKNDFESFLEKSSTQAEVVNYLTSVLGIETLENIAMHTLENTIASKVVNDKFLYT